MGERCPQCDAVGHQGLASVDEAVEASVVKEVVLPRRLVGAMHGVVVCSHVAQQVVGLSDLDVPELVQVGIHELQNLFHVPGSLQARDDRPFAIVLQARRLAVRVEQGSVCPELDQRVRERGVLGPARHVQGRALVAPALDVDVEAVRRDQMLQDPGHFLLGQLVDDGVLVLRALIRVGVQGVSAELMHKVVERVDHLTLIALPQPLLD
mmetsp:Transcript_17295/g.51900  ORF Transcript_17295/g.51900 Transcript_17295/m.51900 type:complete len:209 (-) Transcript_17295:112-738(-)